MPNDNSTEESLQMELYKTWIKYMYKKNIKR